MNDPKRSDTPLTPSNPLKFSVAPARGVLAEKPFMVKSALALVDAGSTGTVRELRLYALPQVSCSNADDALFLRLRIDQLPAAPGTALRVGLTVAVEAEQVAPYFDSDLGRWRTQSLQLQRGVLRWDALEVKAKTLRASVLVSKARLAGVIEAVICEV